MQSIKVNENKYINFCRGKACGGKSFTSSEPLSICYKCQIIEAEEDRNKRQIMDIAEENKYPYLIFKTKEVELC